MRLSRDVMPLEKNRMSFIHIGVLVQKEFPSEFPSKEQKFSRNVGIAVHCYTYVHTYDDALKMGIMKCILLQSFHLKDECLPQMIYNSIRAMGFSAMFTFQLQIILKGKQCRRPIAVMGVVDHLGHYRPRLVLFYFEFCMPWIP